MPWGAAASIGGSLISGALGSGSADDAAKASAKATAASNKMLKEQMATNTSNYSPYTSLGSDAANKLSYYLGLTDTSPQGQYNQKYGTLLDMSGGVPKAVQSLYDSDPAYRSAYDQLLASHQAKYTNSRNPSGGYTADSDSVGLEAALRRMLPGADSFSALDTSDGNYGSLLNNFSQNDLNKDVVYNTGLQFGLDQGTSALNRLASANGGIDSGATLKALTRYANDYGTTKASGAYDRFNTNKLNNYNMLSGQSGQGLNATSSLAGINSNLLTGMTNNTMANGQAQGQYGIQGASAINNAVQGGIGNYLYNQRTSTPSNSSIVGASQLGGGPGINLSGYTSSIPWYA